MKILKALSRTLIDERLHIYVIKTIDDTGEGEQKRTREKETGREGIRFEIIRPFAQAVVYIDWRPNQPWPIEGISDTLSRMQLIPYSHQSQRQKYYK